MTSARETLPPALFSRISNRGLSDSSPSAWLILMFPRVRRSAIWYKPQIKFSLGNLGQPSQLIRRSFAPVTADDSDGLGPLASDARVESIVRFGRKLDHRPIRNHAFVGSDPTQRAFLVIADCLIAVAETELAAFGLNELL